ncbi:hypothetical protein L195_g060290, partial [Trifolium pratense]
LSHPPAAALNPSLTALNLSPSPRSSISAAAARTTAHQSPRRTALTLSPRLVTKF